MTTKTKSMSGKRLKISWRERAWKPPICRVAVRSVFPRRQMPANCPTSKSVNRGLRLMAFTLVELLVVIAIIAILAGLLLPALARVKLKAQRTQARTEMLQIKTAIEAYHTEYSRYPSPTNVITNDFTFGDGQFGSTQTGYSTNFLNGDLMAILLNEDRYCNSGYQKNPRKVGFLSVSKRAADTNSPGLGPDLVFRDPWRHPYLITIDYNYDDRCQDDFYKKTAVSQQNGDQGYNGLYATNGTDFELNSPVMIWSVGPDGKADATKKAVDGNNADNVLSWGSK